MQGRSARTPELERLEPRHIRFAFLDVDGTIMNAQHQISSQTVRALRDFRARGGEYGLASGRPYFGAKHVIQQLDIAGPCVLFSGALVVEAATGNILCEEVIAPNMAKAVLEFARRESMFIEVYTRESYFIDAPSAFGDLHATYLGFPPTVRSLDEVIASEKILKLEFISQTPAEAEKLRAYASSFAQLNFGFGYGAAHPHILFGNVTSLSASREQAFKHVLAHLQMRAETVASFGDAEADIPFFKLSGLSVAMGNAPQSVKSAAKFVTKSVEDDGVAFVIDQLSPQASL